MKTVAKLSLLAFALTLASCNEKVSPELQEGSSTPDGDSDGPTIIPPEYYFKLKNTAPTILNYKLHKTGAGNMSTDCKVSSASALSNDNFRGDPATYDITCYMEAEELSLNLGGLSFEIESSPNTCDAVAYSPFSYYNRRPGDSSGTYTFVQCTNEDTTSARVAALDAADGSIDLSGVAASAAGCNQMVSDVIAPAQRVVASIPESVEDLCRFNYESGEKCDVGTINIRKLLVTYDPDSTLTTYKYQYEKYKCGGKVVNCIDGPIKSHTEIPFTSGTLYQQTTYDETYVRSFEYKSLFPDRENYTYANYRRNLANSNIDYDIGTFPYIASYLNAFNDAIFGRTYDPNLVERYSRNRLPDNSGVIIDTTSLPDSVLYENDTYTAKPLAADPFIGHAGGTNPFYTFICYDTAWDIKARIKLVIRDWDRLVPASTDMELLSDVYKGISARQDNDEEEFPDEIPFNDTRDWDDLIRMNRDDTGVLIYEPVDGFYSSGIFPNYTPPED